MKPLRIKPLALSLGSFSGITYILCILWGLLVPSTVETSHKYLSVVLPGFQWLTLGSFLLGLVESLVYGVYAAGVFAPLYNLFIRLDEREAPAATPQTREVHHHP